MIEDIEKQKHLKLLRDGDGCFQSVQFEDQGGINMGGEWSLFGMRVGDRNGVVNNWGWKILDGVPWTACGACHIINSYIL